MRVCFAAITATYVLHVVYTHVAVAILRGGWVDHGPQIFALPPVWPPQFFS